MVVMILVMDGQLAQAFTRELATTARADMWKQLERAGAIARLAHMAVPVQLSQQPRLSLSIRLGLLHTTIMRVRHCLCNSGLHGADALMAQNAVISGPMVGRDEMCSA